MAQNLTIYAKYVAAGSSSNQIYQDCIMAGSSSQDATETAYPTNTNPTNTGYTYLSSATVQKTYSTNSYEVLNPTSADLHTRGQYTYHITGSTIIPKGVATFTTSSLGLGPANTTAKVSIPISNFTSLFNNSLNTSNDLKGISVLSYNGVISTLAGYNEFSSSTFNNFTESFAVMYVSASKANMGSIAANDLYLSLGTFQLPTGPTGRYRATISENISDIIGGGSGALTFNGTDQYFTALNADVVNWLPGTGDFTIEMFIKQGENTPSTPRVFSLGNDTTATIGISIEGGTCYVWPYGSNLSAPMPAGYLAGTDWAHIAICRSGTTTKLFINGVLKKTKLSDNRNITDAINPGFDLNVGVDDPEGNANFWPGSLTNFRWDNSAIYTGASLTVPTAPLEVTATTKLLMLGGGASNPVYDAAQLNSLVNNGAGWTAETPFV